jgi:aspartate-semialdehyde dehydrogenase
MKKYHIAVVGATGAVGGELLRVLERRSFPVASVHPIGSARSAGKHVRYCGESIAVETLGKQSFDKIEIAFFSAGGDISRQHAPVARNAGAVVIDNSSVFRMELAVPLVIPEINGADIRKHRGLIANPNCTTAVALMAIYPLHRAFGVGRVFAASYQAVSGSGQRAIDELKQQIEAAAQDRQLPPQIYPHPIAFNLLPHVDMFLENGYTKEEMKMQNEGRKIMHLPAFRASVTCVRVPVYRAHSVAISAEFERKVSVAQAHEVLAKAPGLELVDEPHNNRYPMPLNVTGKDNCYVGRVGKRAFFLGFGRSIAQRRSAERRSDRGATVGTMSSHGKPTASLQSPLSIRAVVDVRRTTPDFPGPFEYSISLKGYWGAGEGDSFSPFLPFPFSPSGAGLTLSRSTPASGAAPVRAVDGWTFAPAPLCFSPPPGPPSAG